MKRLLALMLVCGGAVGVNCAVPAPGTEPTRVHLITLDPGHFHAALVQKFMYANVDPEVHVYAPDGDDLHSVQSRHQP